MTQPKHQTECQTEEKRLPRESIEQTSQAGSGSLTQAAMLPMLYDADQSYGWSHGMRQVTHALLHEVALPPGPVLEVGCGGGQMLLDLHHHFEGRTVCGVDLHPLALAHAQALLPTGALSQASLQQLPYDDGSFALIVAMDVFDQQGVDLAAALAESYRLLRPGGALLLRVSAYPWLYGAHDIAFHTGRRYARHEIADALAQVGLRLARMSHANAALAAPVALIRLAQRYGLLPWSDGLYRQDGLHTLAVWLLHQEATWLQRADLPLGLSLYALARKPDSARK